ncbi:MAG: hypothetical protein KGZ58_11915 [Ignavibacteriales bacterium]|nr:hypothetical protein [Ignavibacteriales bacterium]
MKKLLLTAIFFMTIANVSFAQRTLINKGDQYLGAKLALGSIGGASTGFIGTYEMGYMENIGIGGSIAYSGYTDSYNFGLWKGEWTYSNILVMASGTYHFDVAKNEKLDTWGALNIGYNVASASFKWTSNGVPSSAKSPSVSAGGVVIGLSANARYMLSEKWYATAGIGFGLGVLNLGVDYKL